MMSHVEQLLISELANFYTPTTKQYSVLTPMKAIQRLRFGSDWTEEKRITRSLANGREEQFVILSKPINPTPKSALQRVKEAIRGNRSHN